MGDERVQWATSAVLERLRERHRAAVHFEREHGRGQRAGRRVFQRLVADDERHER